MNRLSLSLVILLLGGLLLSACVAATPAAAPAEPEAAAEAPAEAGIPRPEACDAENPFIAVALPNLTNPYYVAMQQGFEDAAAEAGFEVEIQIADNDDAQQLAQVQAMLLKKPCALALNGVKSEPAAAIVKSANDAGVPVFTVNVIVSEEALIDQDATIVQYLGADNKAGGSQTAEMILEDLGADAAMKIGFVTEPDEVPTLAMAALRRQSPLTPTPKSWPKWTATSSLTTASRLPWKCCRATPISTSSSPTRAQAHMALCRRSSLWAGMMCSSMVSALPKSP